MKRLLAFLREHEWRIVVATVATTFALGYVGLPEYQPGLSRSDRVYLALQLFVLQLPVLPGQATPTIEAARFLGAGVAFYTVLRALGALFHDQLQRLRLRRARGHVVVCGLGRKGLQLVKDFLRQGERVVVIERDEENDHVATARDLGATVLVGSATEDLVLRIARVERAGHLVALCDDGTNVEVALAAQRLVARGRPPALGPLACHVHIVDLRLCGLLRHHRVLGGDGAVEVRVFNMFESGARVLLRDQPLDRVELREGDPRGVHLVVIGFGQMGESVAVHAARQAHFANLRRPRVTIVDRRADERRASVLGRYPCFEQVCDLDALKGDVEDPAVLGALAAWGEDEARLLDVAVCFDDDRRSLAAALALVDLLRTRRVPVRVRMSQEAGLSALTLQGDGGAPWSGRISVFGLLDRLCTRENVLGEALDLLARTAHERYLARKLAEGEAVGSRPALRPWRDLDESYRESNRQQADHIPVKLRAVGCRAVPARGPAAPPLRFTPAEVELLARMEHARWCARHWLAGWRHGPARGDAARVHPRRVARAALPEPFRENDREAVRSIPDLLACVGQRVERVVTLDVPAAT